MPRTIIVETLDEFVQRHGGASLQVERNLWVLPDGASVLDLGHGLRPAMREPPTDDYERLQLQIKYEQAFMERVRRFFDRLKSGELLVYEWPPLFGPEPRDPDLGRGAHPPTILRRLQELYREHKQRLHELQAQLAETPQGRQQAAVQEARRRVEQRAAIEQAQLRAEIDSITLDDGDTP